MDASPDLLEFSSRRLIDHCRTKLRWRDLSNDVVMDIGCGEDWNCGKAILNKFGRVKAFIGIDNNLDVVHNFESYRTDKLECVCGDIEKREYLQKYEGKIDKVVSTDLFHLLTDQVEAFRNVYRLLKPGGEAAILFLTKSIQHEWVMEMLKKTKWKNAFKCQYIEDSLKSGFGEDHYRELVTNMGFQVVECKEEKINISYVSDELCKDGLYEFYKSSFNIPSEMVDEFKEDCLQAMLKLSARDEEGKPCYRATELSLLIIKPQQKAPDLKQNNLVLESLHFN